MFKKIKEMIKGKENTNEKEEVQPPVWLEPADTPWDIPVMDIRPYIGNRMLFSTDPDKAKNAISFAGDTGVSFIGEDPMKPRKISVSLFYPTEGQLLDGVFFTPREMEDKWAIFYHGEKIIMVRSWQRRVVIIGHTREVEGGIEVHSLDGIFSQEEESPELTTLYFDILMRNGAFGIIHPITYPSDRGWNDFQIADWCFSFFGRLAVVATDKIVNTKIEIPLRVNSIFHIGVARQDKSVIDHYLEQGIHSPWAVDGQTPLQWAVQMDYMEIVSYLVEKGVPIDMPSNLGATALMYACQNRKTEMVQLLLTLNADVNVYDARGFTSLHRTVEMGELELTKILLDQGADPGVEAEGYTIRSLAEKENHKDMLKLLDSYST